MSRTTPFDSEIKKLTRKLHMLSVRRKKYLEKLKKKSGKTVKRKPRKRREKPALQDISNPVYDEPIPEVSGNIIDDPQGEPEKEGLS